MDDINSESKSQEAGGSPHRDEEKIQYGETSLRREKSWATRNGLNLASFTPHEDSGAGTVDLERTMKPRHLNMIAIGGRFVGIQPSHTHGLQVY